MNLTIAQADLAAAIARIVRVVERKNTIPILSNLLLTAAGEALTLTATDLDIEATTHAPASITASGTTTLPAGMLADIVRKIDKGATITLALDDTRATCNQSGVILMSFSARWLNYFFDIAKINAQMSKDPNTQVGAVVVDSDRNILSTGFNGFPR